MLRFIYLLSLLLCIELSFCYNYIDEVTEQNPNKIGRNVRRERGRKVKRPREQKNLIRQEYDYDRSPVEFDVASFIQPEEENMEEDDGSMRHRIKKRRRTNPKTLDYGQLMGMNDDKKRDKSADYLNVGDNPSELNLNPPLFKESPLGSKHYNPLEDIHGEKYGHEKFRNIYKDDLLIDQNVVHNHEKKCTLKNIKFPFFSHNKSEPLKPKKTKKRKLFCFNCPKKEVRLPDDLMKINDETMGHYKMKRSFEEKLCPSCKKVYLGSMETNARRKKAPRIFFHNSRQFYQNTLPEPKLKEDGNLRYSVAPYASETLDSNYRIKREDDRERQLKELEEVQRKIDNVEIHLPTFDKPAEKSIYTP